MRNRRWWSTLVIGTAWVLAFGMAFGQEAESIELRIELGEFYFQVDGQDRNAAIVLDAGQSYLLTFANVGTMEHEVLIGQGLLTDDGIADGYETNLLDQVEMDVVGDGWFVEVAGMIEFELEEGEQITLKVTVPEALVGIWEIGCFIPGHYEAGMKAPFEIR